MHEPPNVIRVVGDSERPTDDVRDTGSRPEIGGVAEHGGAFEQKIYEAGAFLRSQSRGTTRRSPYLECLAATLLQAVAPTHHGTGSAADAPGNFVEGDPELQELRGT